MKRLLLLCIICFAWTVKAETIDVKTFRYVTPYPVQTPFMVDSLDVNGKPFSLTSLLDTRVALDNVKMGKEVSLSVLPNIQSDYALGLIGFTLENHKYTSALLDIEGLHDYKTYIDGKECSRNLVLEPETHFVTIKYLAQKDRCDSLKITLHCDDELIVSTTDKRMFSLNDVLYKTEYTGLQLSHSGKYLNTLYSETQLDGSKNKYSIIRELPSGRVVTKTAHYISFMPLSESYIYLSNSGNQTDMVKVNPVNGEESIFAKNIPSNTYSISPTEDFIIFTLTQSGPHEKKDIYRVETPNDRQNGWRSRSYLVKYDVKSGLVQPLTYGYKNVTRCSISSDGKYLLFYTKTEDLTKRPTTSMSLYRMNLTSLAVDTLVTNDGFLFTAFFSTDSNRVFIGGSPEALGGIGSCVKEEQIPNKKDVQLYLMDIDTKNITPLTQQFNPSVLKPLNRNNGDLLYFTANNNDSISLYALDYSKKSISQIETKEEVVNGLALDISGKYLVYCGQSVSNSDRLYLYNTKSKKTELLEDLNKNILNDVQLGECNSWNFVSSRGDTIYGRYYLPPYFDASKQYPMIVNFYGGCSPTERNFDSRYPLHLYAAMGYVVYVVQPSGAIGFGQEFSARHVNTAGKGVAEDIIEGTMKFTQEHSFVNPKKIGCIGASYGGFMSQYLQTQTDIFAAAISHAGISDHTSYWGEGYWGYSYSEISMANSYPWTRKDLYVDQSPLYNADKINTPILFLHGNEDMNVPLGESVQMFTALKMLGKETAMVIVDGEEHHILNTEKRIQWQNTIFAWFAKWLQDDDSWWKALYKPLNL